MMKQLSLNVKANQSPIINFWILFCVFFFNPFLCFLLVIYHLGKEGSLSTRKNAYFFISLFLGFVAYTQNTKTGDLVRTYEDIVNSHYNLSYGFSFFILQSKHILYDIVNQTIYSVTREVRLVSLFWIFMLFYCTLMAIENIVQIEKYRLTRRELCVLIVATIFCFVIFTQVTELMKQGVATSLFLYAFSQLLRGKKVMCTVVIIAAINIHFSVFFLLPVLFVRRIPPLALLTLLFVSFFFREFGLMEFILSKFESIPFLGEFFMMESVLKSAESYQNQMDNFFNSDSPYFLFQFWSFFLITILFCYFIKKEFFINVCLSFLIILNFCYKDNHNYTRLLTMLFPFYIALFFTIKQINNKTTKNSITNILLFCTFLANARIFVSRITSTGYGTSFLDNSLLNLLYYPSFMYLL